MNYDPIHDTYASATESKAVSGDPKNIKSTEHDLLHLLAIHSSPRVSQNEHSSILHDLNQSTASSRLPLDRPQSNLHLLLDNSPSEPAVNNRDKSFHLNGTSNIQAPNMDSVTGTQPGTENGTRYPQDIIDKNSNGTTSPSSLDTSASRDKDEHVNVHPDAGNVLHRAPLKDVKFSINNLVSSDPHPETVQNKTTGFLGHCEISSPSALSDQNNQKGSDGLDQFAHFDDSDSPSSDPEVPIGMLPPDFRSISIGSLHLKKSDGKPFWRKDIQYDFLKELFNDTNRVFTNHFPRCEIDHAVNNPKLTFAELYIRTLAESSKCSKILSERLIRDPEVGVAVSKVCLLVNAGRINTTVNFVPDMRSALRTYHLIPSLQVGPDGSTKPLQDTPRLKTIIKAVCDDQNEQRSLLNILKDPSQTKPNTNIIKLIFLLSNFFQNVPYHYHDSIKSEGPLQSLEVFSNSMQNRFMEFFLDHKIHPKCRAKRFLWLIYTYMETSFKENELEQNPFNPHRIPPIEYISPEDFELFDIDTDYEIEFATKMYHTRILHLKEEENSDTNPKKGAKPRKDSKKRSAEQSDESGHDPINKSTVGVLVIADDSMLVDDADISVRENVADVSDIADVTVTAVITEPSEPSTKPSLNSDRQKRKKVTAPIGSTVEAVKKAHSQAKLENPEFPIKNLKRIRTNFSFYTKELPIQSLEKESPLSILQKKTAAQNSKDIISHMAQKVPNYKEKRKEVTQWMFRYFQYKKSTGNGLLGMEWEDIRNDVVNGIETYLYQKLGKSLITHNYAEKIDEERHENGEPELLKRETFATLPGDSAPIDVSDLGNFGSGFSSSHDFDNANERITYEYLLLQIVDDLLANRSQIRLARAETVHFDLEAETVLFKKAN